MAFQRPNFSYTPESPSLALSSTAYSPQLDGVISAVEKFAQGTAVQAGASAAMQDVMSGKNPQPSLGLTTAGQAYNLAAEEAYKVKTTNDLRTKSLEVMKTYSGMNAGDSVAADNMMKAHVDALTKSVPEQFRPAILQEADLRRSEVVARVQAAENDHSFRLNIATIEDGIKQDTEEAQMRARDGNEGEVQLISQRLLDRSQKLLGLGVISPEQASAGVKDYQDIVHAEKAIGGALRSGNIIPTMEAVQNGRGEFETTPLKTRKYIISELSRELAWQSATDKKYKEEADRLVKEIDNNVVLPPQRQALRDGIIKGSIPVPLEYRSRVIVAHQAAEAFRDLAAKPVEAGRTVLADVQQSRPETLEEALVRKSVLEKWAKHEAALTDPNGDPIRHLTGLGMMVAPGTFPIGGERPATVVDVSSADFFAQLEQQKFAVQANEQRLQTTLPVLRQSEADAIGAFLSSPRITPQQKLERIQQVNNALGERSTKAFQQIDKRYPGMSVLGKMDVSLATEALDGMSLIAEAKHKKPEFGQVKQSPLYDKTVQALDEGEMQGYLDAVDSVYVSRMSKRVFDEDSMGKFDAEEYDNAIRDVIGEVAPYGLLDSSGQNTQVLLPKGMDETQWKKVVYHTDDFDVAAMGGSGEIADLISGRKNWVGTNARFHRIGENRYEVYDGSNRVMDATGMKPFIFDPTKVDMTVKAGAFSEFLTSFSDTISAMGEGSRAGSTRRFQ